MPMGLLDDRLLDDRNQVFGEDIGREELVGEDIGRDIGEDFGRDELVREDIGRQAVKISGDRSLLPSTPFFMKISGADIL
jgi:hypothetical protein